MNWPLYCKQYANACCDLYNKYTGRSIDLKHPMTFTEKIQWLKIYDSTFLKTFAADKVTVHDYYAYCLGQDIGIPIIATYNKITDIKWSELPNDIIIKCNHGSGYNHILHGKNSANISNCEALLRKWMSEDYASRYYELHYSLIPRKILVEPYIPNLTDTKIFCFNGTPKFYQIDRHLSDCPRMNFYDFDGNPITWLSNRACPANYSSKDNIPSHLDLMLDYAKKLATPFKFVRVDFYDTGADVYGGELTFTPGAGLQSYIGDGDQRLGDMLDL